MSKRTPTPEQQAAIDAAGEVLVSASAGSGKTFVMIEKMIALILSQRAEVSSVLAVTFTRLAAGEMKERLRAALTARIGEETDPAARARLKAQLSEVPTADICTLHAFCTNVIRRYFYEGGMDGNFRVLEEDEAAKLRARAAAAALEKLAAAPSPAFSAALSAFAGSRGFGALQREVLRLYEKVVSRADYRAFLEGMPARLGAHAFDALAEEMLASVRAAAAQLRDRCAKLYAYCRSYVESGALTARVAAFLEGRRALAEEVLAAPDVFAAAALFAGLKLQSKPPLSDLRKAGDAALLDMDGEFAAVRDACDALKAQVQGLRAREEERADFLSAGQAAAGLAEAVLAFDDAYADLKRRAGGMDFSDLEHKCLALLRIPRVGEEVRARYTHVFVDEYQDVNPAQQGILSLVAGENVFMVGDAKQSIYGFRGCSPAYFTQSYDRLRGQGRALTLNGNFRSGSALLDFVNRLFSRVMTRADFSIDYAATSRMFAGNPAQQGGRVHISFLPEEEEEAERPARGIYSVAEHLGPAEDEEFAEGALIADIILQEVGRTRLDPATGAQVPTRFGDIVILSRALTSRAARIVAELVRRGIPVAAAAKINVCDYPEVKTLIALLQFLDNGAQDIPLAAALKSALGGLTDGELAAIRLAGKRPEGKDEPFYLACERYAAEGQDALAEKLRTFFSRAEMLRLRMQVRGAADILAGILSETGMEADLLARPCGAERMRRVRRFIEECGALSVPAFLDKLKSGGYDVGFSESGGEDAVRLMTMHASKGLEFPVVIVAGMSENFSNKELTGVYYDDDWGFVPPAYDAAARVRRETILRRAVHERLRRRRAADELRLLYVALTRAKSVLHLVFEKEKPFDPARAAAAGCMADFVDFSAFEGFDAAQGEESEQAARGGLFAPVFGGAVLPPSSRVLAAGEPDAAAAQAVRAMYCAPYPHAAALGLPVKTSPSQLLRERAGELAPAEETDAAARLAEECYATPADAATGTAYHAFLEQADFSAPPAAEIARVRALLPPEQAALLDDARLTAILKMPIFAEIGGFSLRREQPFLLGMPASKLYAGAPEDTVLVQGVIDLLAVRGEEAAVIDYKYSARSDESLRAHYAPQMEVYVAAAEQWPGVRRVRAYLVNILRGCCIRVR